MATSTINDNLKHEIDALNSKTTVEAITFTPAAGITSSIFMRKVGNIVMINGYVTSSTAFSSSETVIGTIPTGSRPADAVRALAGVAAQAYSLGDYAYVSVGSQGNVAITAKSGNTYKVAYFSVSYASYY